MGEIYKNPLRVYLILGLLGLWGILSGLSLPVSLFPNSSKPKIQVSIPYGSLTADEFYKSYGEKIESRLSAILVDDKRIDKLFAEYNKNAVRYEVEFSWGTVGEKALTETQTLMASLSNTWPEESQRQYSVFTWRENSGFLAVSFYSPTRTLDQLYDLLLPFTTTMSSAVPDAEGVSLYNPKNKQIEISLNVEKMASLQIMPAQIIATVGNLNQSMAGGTLKLGRQNLVIDFPRQAHDLDSFKRIPIFTNVGQRIQLQDIADVQLKTNTQSSRSYKTSGVASLILFASPKPDGNIKKMADDVMAQVIKVHERLPKDIQFKVLVNPSEFINSSIKSVVKEVMLAAFIAVLILLVFIGSLKNVITAAIEIPLSIVMAFIFMKIFDVNLNLISLGGLALSAGMNVDASVVVMENIFRHFDKVKNKLNPEEQLGIVLKAVKEVSLPLLASTLASLVVFLPLMLTSGLTNSILGDLAKAVIFSHSMSAVVALVLVPTVRLHMMRTETNFHITSPIDKPFSWLEDRYEQIVSFLILKKYALSSALIGVAALLVVLSFFVLPKLPKEIIGRPETDWMILGFHGSSFTQSRQIESFAEKVEYDLMAEFGEKVQYTFTQVNGTRNANIMIRLKDRRELESFWKSLEGRFIDSPTVSYWMEPWNPSELPIPDPPDVWIEVRGGETSERNRIAENLRIQLLESQAFPRMRANPDSSYSEHVVVLLHHDVLKPGSPGSIRAQDLSTFARIATEGLNIGNFQEGDRYFPILVNLTDDRIKTLEDLKGLPIPYEGKIVPFSTFAEIKMQKADPYIYSYNQASMSLITAREDESKKDEIPAKQKIAKDIVEKFSAQNQSSKVSVAWLDPNTEVNEALNQLQWALALSILLIFVIMVIQFGDIVNSLLVLVAIPFGLIGVMISLYLFNSTLSLNSALGTILLNGIAVANSIILVDFINKLMADGLSPVQAAIQASRTRLKPILMTSLTTVLGMAPIAIGYGEGGRILQPLGISVAGGLWFSMILTVLLVPALQAHYLLFKMRKRKDDIQKNTTRNTDWSIQGADLR